MARRFPNVLFDVKAIFCSVPLNNFVMNVVSFPMYVNLAHIRPQLSGLCTLFLLKFSSEPSYFLLSYMCLLLSVSFCLFSGSASIFPSYTSSA
jgi:hypothetical protein